MTAWALYVVGCGTVGFWVTRRLTRSPLAQALARLLLVDRARIRAHNVITCPLYSSEHIGRFKSMRLAELARQWSQNAQVKALVSSVEEMDWETAFSAQGRHISKAVVVLGVDSWPPRLVATEDLRLHAVEKNAAENVLLMQVGLDRGEAQVGVYGQQFKDACPACGLGTLPGAEPCVLFSSPGELLRGNLWREARAAARQVEQILSAELGLAAQPASWVGTKANLVLGKSGKKTLTRRCHRVEGCLGPHGHTPIRWDLVLPPRESHPVEKEIDRE